MKEYELFVPLFYNDGLPVEPGKIERIGERLLDQFGGAKFFPQPNQGMWTEWMSFKRIGLTNE